MRGLSRGLVVAAVLAPLIVLLARVGWPDLPTDARAGWLILVSLVQATLSTGLTMILGVTGSLGILAVRSATRVRILEALALVPAGLPPLFVILSCLNVVTSLVPFPFGLFGVVGVHVWMNSGLVAVALARIVRSRFAGQLELATVEGASRWQIWRLGLWPQLKTEFRVLGLMVFLLCLTSYAVPTTVGGIEATSLEVVIVEELQSGGGVRTALGLALIEILLLAGAAQIVGHHPAARREQARLVHGVGLAPLLAVPTGFSILLLFGFVIGLKSGSAQFGAWPELRQATWAALVGSVAVGLAVAGAVTLLLAATVYGLPSQSFRRWLLGLSAPTTVVVGLALFTVGPASGGAVYGKLIYGLSILSLPVLYRWLVDPAVASLTGQIQVARCLGASWRLIFRQITWPQIRSEVALAAAVAAVWAMGDFALSALVASQDLTLAMVIEDLMGAYRLELATWLQAILLVVAAAVAALIVGVEYVTRSQPRT